MNTPHSEEHERLLERVLGSGDRTSAEFATLLKSCPSCRAKAAEFDAVARRLNAAGQFEQEVLREAQDMTGPPGEERVAEIVRDGPPRARRRRIWPWLVAAGALVALGLWVATRDGGPPEDLYLNVERVPGMAPQGEAESFEKFTWALDLPPGGTFTVEVWRGGDEEGEDPLITVDNLSQQTWAPTTDQLASMGNAILWRVTAFDAFAAEQTSRQVRARLLP